MATQSAAKLGKAVASQEQLENDLVFLTERVEHLVLMLHRIDLDNFLAMRTAVEKLRFDAETIARGLGDLRHHLGHGSSER